MATKEQAEKRHEHFAMAKAPDWKYTPKKPNKGVPVPYFTISYFDEAVRTANQSHGRSNDYFISLSRVPKSYGGEAGKGKGVLSNAYMDEFEPTEWSSTLAIDGGFAVFHGHAGTINKGNAPAKVYTTVTPAQAVADKACWEQLKTNLSALGVTSKDRMFNDPTGCGTDVLSGAWGTISGDVKAVGDMLGSIWGGIKAFFSDPLGSMSSAVEGLKKFGQAAYDAGEQVVGIVQGLRDGSITMDDLMDFAADMLQDQLCAMAQQAEDMVKQGKGCEAVGVIMGQVAMTVAATFATAGAGAAGKAALMLKKAGVGKGDDIATAIKKLKAFKKKNKTPDADAPKPAARVDGDKDSNTPGKDKPDPCPLCPTVGKPVNPVLGCKVLSGPEDLDFELPAVLPLSWQRTYTSSNPHVSWLGQGWSLPWCVFIEERRTPAGPQLDLVDEFGRAIAFPLLAPGDSHFNTYEQITLTALDAEHLELCAPDGAQHLVFRALGNKAGARRRYALVRVFDRNDNALRFVYADEVLALPTHIEDSAGRVYGLHFAPLPNAQGRREADHRLTQVDWLEAPAGVDAEQLSVTTVRSRTLVQYRYSPAGDLIEVIDRSGRVRRRFEYRNHLLAAHVLPGGVRAEYTYDQDRPAGRVLRSVSSLGERYDFDYRAGHTIVTDQLGRQETYHHNSDREWTGTTDALGGRRARDLDGHGNLIALTDAAGRTTRYGYDQQGRPTRVQAPGPTALEVQTTQLDYDEASGQVARITDAAGGRTSYAYDERGNLAAVTNALGQRTAYQHDARGLPVLITDALGRSKRLEYNTAGQLLRYTDCSGSVTHYAYDGWGHLSRVSDALGHATRYEHDDHGLLRAIHHPDGASEQFDYDEADRLVAHTDALGRRTEYTLAPDGLPTSRRNALGGVLRYEYDPARRLAALFNENEARYDFAYDALDRLVEEVGFDAHQTRYGYDAGGLVARKLEVGCLTRQQRLQARIAREAPDGDATMPPRALQRGTPTLEDPWGLGLADESAVPDAGAIPGHAILTHYERDAAGRLTAKRVVGHVLDEQERAQRQHKHTRYRYDELGRLVEAANDGGSRVELRYDALGQLVAETTHGPGGQRTLAHRYDALGNRTATTLPDGRTINQLYYGSGHLHQVNIDGDVVSDIERDALHREVQRSQGALLSHYRYDAVGRLIEQGARVAAGRASASLDPQAGQRLIGRRYGYDRAGNLLSIDDARHGPTRYGYDPIGRLLSAAQPSLAERFAFDPAHNLVAGDAQSAGPGASTGRIQDNRVTVFEDKRYRYDTHGNVIEKRIGKHTLMRLLWNVEHQLACAIVTRNTHTAHPRRSVTHYRYDAFGRRVEKRDEEAGTTRFDWDGNRLLAELRGAKTRLYLYEPDSFAPLAMVTGRAAANDERTAQHQVQARPSVDDDDEDTPRRAAAKRAEAMLAEQQSLRERVGRGAASNQAPSDASTPAVVASRAQPAGMAERAGTQVHYFHNDQIGTPRELTDRSGRIAWQATYKAWGNTLRVEAAGQAPQTVQWLRPDEDDAVEQNLRFQGQYFDAETGLHYNRFRYYDPDVGRFASRDPIGLWGGVNLTLYAPNPNNYADPYGLACDPKKATHITYLGSRGGLPYIGYASMPGKQAADAVLRYRYSNNFSTFDGGQAPVILYEGYGQAGKDTARGLEQRYFEQHGGKDLTANSQSPVGPRNRRRDKYLEAADAHLRKCKPCKEKDLDVC